MQITEPAPAKINLALHLRRKRPDGYHDLETLFAFARDGDVVTVEAAAEDRFTITGPFADDLLRSPIEGRGGASEAKGGDGVSNNLVIRARDAFRDAFMCPPVAITLDKCLPIASGIGGGSADAAATLRALARLNGIDPADSRLYTMAATLGADVTACLNGRTAIGTGRGDKLTPLTGLPDTPMLLINPGVAVSTAAVFAGWNGIDRGSLAADGDLLTRARTGRNDLQLAALAIAPVISDVLALVDTAPGTLLARMSGSGATCFALFESTSAMQAAAVEAQGRAWWTLATTLAD